MTSSGETRSHRVPLLQRRRLTDNTFELTLARPSGFTFRAGQKITIELDGITREYSLVSGERDPRLTLCIRKVPDGRLTPRLAALPIKSLLNIHGPHGYFLFQETARRSVCVATGSGIAPFVSYMRSGVRVATLLHGVSQASQLYYRNELLGFAKIYLPCITGGQVPVERDSFFAGRVTQYLADVMERSPADFYLCGRSEMIRDVTLLLDEQFPDVRIYSEIYY